MRALTFSAAPGSRSVLRHVPSGFLLEVGDALVPTSGPLAGLRVRLMDVSGDRLVCLCADAVLPSVPTWHLDAAWVAVPSFLVVPPGFAPVLEGV